MFGRLRNTAVCLHAGRGRRKARSAALATVGVIALGLGGCAGDPGKHLYDDVPASLDVRDRHPIRVDRDVPELQVVAKQNGRGLSGRQRAEIRSFLAAFKDEGGGRIVIDRPIGSSNEFAALGAVATIKRMIDENGVLRERVVLSSYRPGHKHGASPVVLSFARYRASVAPCGDWSKNVAVTYDNKPYRNFGCAYQANIAAMVDDPRDLVHPSEIDPPDTARRSVVLDQYREGQSTASEKSEEQDANISEVAQ